MTKLILMVILFAGLTVNAQKIPNLVATPPMGWNSWNKFGCDVSEKLIKEIGNTRKLETLRK